VDIDFDQPSTIMEYGTFAPDPTGGETEKAELLYNDEKQGYIPSFEKEGKNLVLAIYWKVYFYNFMLLLRQTTDSM